MPPKTSNKYVLLGYYIRQHWLSYSLGTIAILATNWIAVSIPEYIQLSIDLLNNDLEARQDLLWEYMLIMLGLAVVMIIVRTLSRILFFNPGRAIECQIKNDMFQKLMALQKNYYDANPSGNIISRINNDITGVRMICGFALMQSFNITTALSMTPYKMWQLSPSLTLYCIIPIVIVFTAVRLGMRVLVRNMRARMESLQRLSGFTVSSLSAIDIIKSQTMREWGRGRFENENQDMLRRSMKIALTRSFVLPMLSNLEYFLKLLVLLVGGIMVIKADLTIGQLTAFIAYSALLTLPLMGLGWVSTMIQQGLVGLSSIQTVLQQKLPRTNIESLPQNELKSLFTEKGLAVNNLSYRYPMSKKDALQNICCQINPGQVIGLLGRIGSGKSTLVNGLNRYLDMGTGSIFIGKKDLAELSDNDIRSCIRTVTQEPFLFSDSVENNIRFSEDLDNIENLEHFRNIIRAAALEDEVARFPNQENTMVGEKGIMLSGGQKQRISLARAMLKPCDLLILDNVLSAVDYETERYLLREIHKLLLTEKDMPALAGSILIVSHRVTAMEKSDWILVLDEGQIVDQGVHKDLIQRPGYYQQMWELQNENNS
ncbi:MAG: putative multidrug resistance ABC transporter ATP-binding/permease protein YheI [Deltaproteobacteria bacterium]|jgi:ATP-binding cassette subfamily B protein|nr:putative multidrug resistance ABC transporter ATP-binding/permease protein YheI [Deltaproteobacteria bacterium]